MASSRQLGVLFCFGFKTAMFFLFFRCIPSTAETVIEILKSLNLGFAMASVSQIESHISCNRSCVLSFPSKVFFILLYNRLTNNILQFSTGTVNTLNLSQCEYSTDALEGISTFGDELSPATQR